MRYRCSKCHRVMESDSEPERCEGCKAEIGFDKAEGVPAAMRLFGAALGGAIVTAAAGGILSRLLG